MPDRLFYLTHSGQYVELVPKDTTWPIEDKEVAGATVTRPDGSVGEWVNPKAQKPAEPPPVVPPPVTPPPVVPPPPAVPPPPVKPQTDAPSRGKKWADPAKSPRGDGMFFPRKGATLSNAWVKGYSQNIVIPDGASGPYTLTNVLTTDAWRDSEGFHGQGIYCGEGDNSLTLKSFYAARNGWQHGRNYGDRSMYRHNAYVNKGDSLVVEDSIFAAAACQAIKSMRPAKIRRSFFFANALTFQLLYGLQEIEDCVVYTSSHFWLSGAWNGNIGAELFTKAKFRNVQFVGSPFDAEPPVKVNGAKTYSLGCVVGTRTHGQYKDVPGPELDAADCLISGWPGKPFAGDRPHDGSGFSVRSKTVNVLDDVAAELAAVEKGADIALASARLRELVRSKL